MPLGSLLARPLNPPMKVVLKCFLVYYQVVEQPGSRTVAHVKN